MVLLVQKDPWNDSLQLPVIHVRTLVLQLKTHKCYPSVSNSNIKKMKEWNNRNTYWTRILLSASISRCSAPGKKKKRKSKRARGKRIRVSRARLRIDTCVNIYIYLYTQRDLPEAAAHGSQKERWRYSLSALPLLWAWVWARVLRRRSAGSCFAPLWWFLSRRDHPHLRSTSCHSSQEEACSFSVRAPTWGAEIQISCQCQKTR